MTPREILASTDGSIVSLQVTIRDLAKRIADYDQSLAGLDPADSRRPAIEALRKTEWQRLEESQALLGQLVKARTQLQEAIEKIEG